MNFFKKKFKPQIIFFTLLFILGLIIYDDFGISYDEDAQRLDIGYVNFNFITQNDPVTLPASDGKYHGPAFEIFLVFIENFFKLSDTRSIYLARHLCTFFLFFISVIFFYLTAKNHFQNNYMALLCAAFLVLSPRIFAEAFYNSKDIVFLSLFILSTHTLICFLRKQNFVNALRHALLSALLIDVRIIGVIIPCLTLLFLSTDTIIKFLDKKKFIQNNLVALLIYFAFACGFIILFWPILWLNPMFHFSEAFKEMSHYPWQEDVLYMGRKIQASHLPWHYIPVWIAVTTPVLYLLLFIAGLFFIVRVALRTSLLFYLNHRTDFIFLLCFFLPLFSVIFFHSNMYDGWRHLYFVYPSFIIISIKGLAELKKIIVSKESYILRKIIPAGIVIYLLYIAFVMKASHPHQNVYFNFIAGKPSGKFELDYWGLSFRKGLEYVLRTDSSSSITVASEDIAAQMNIQILPQKDRERVNYTDCLELADYYMDNFRWKSRMKDSAERIFSVAASNAAIMSVYTGLHKLHPAKTIFSFTNDFENNYSLWDNGKTIHIEQTAYSGKNVSELDSSRLFSGGLTFPCDSFLLRKKNIICQASVWKYSESMDDGSILVISIDDKATGKNYFWYGGKVRPSWIIEDVQWKNIKFAVKLPDHIPAEHVLKVYVWNPGKKKFYIDDFYIEILEQNVNN